jgi:hypothetical protein
LQKVKNLLENVSKAEKVRESMLKIEKITEWIKKSAFGVSTNF